jgi:hypothetical protein
LDPLPQQQVHILVRERPSMWPASRVGRTNRPMPVTASTDVIPSVSESESASDGEGGGGWTCRSTSQRKSCRCTYTDIRCRSSRFTSSYENVRRCGRLPGSGDVIPSVSESESASDGEGGGGWTCRSTSQRKRSSGSKREQCDSPGAHTPHSQRVLPTVPSQPTLSYPDSLSISAFVALQEARSEDSRRHRFW